MTNPTLKARVIVADGQSVRGLGIAVFLTSTHTAEIIGRANNAHDTLTHASAELPDAVILDPCLEGSEPALGWICLALKLHCGLAPPRILLHGDERELPGTEDVRELVAACGADGFVDAGLDPARIVEALGRIRTGERVFSLA